MPAAAATAAAVAAVGAAEQWDVRNWNGAAYEAELRAKRLLAAGTVFCTLLLPLEATRPTWLLAASSSGRLSLYSIDQLALQEQLSNRRDVPQESLDALPVVSWQAHIGSVYVLTTYGKHDDLLLLSGGDDGVTRGWRWKDVEACALGSMQLPQPVFQFYNPQSKGVRGALAPAAETNGLAADEQHHSVLVAAGDGNAHILDMQQTRLVSTLPHKEYLHCAAARPSHSQAIFGTDDGSVVIWDLRSGTREAALECATGSSRSQRSQHVSCLALDASEYRLVCGTGSGITSFSLAAMAPTASVACDAPVQQVLLDGSQVLSAGAEPHVTRWSFALTRLSQLPCSASSVYSLYLHQSKVLAIGGTPAVVDVCSDVGSCIATIRTL
eukprot:jgi/Chlat1/5122/Chrsp33S05126